MDCPQRNAMAGLPNEAMLEILARIPFRSVCRSKCVAKAWRDLIEDPLNRGRLPQTLQGFFSIFYLSADLQDCFLKYSASSVPLDIDPCFSFLTKLPEIESLYFLDSCNGLLLFMHTPKSIFNPSVVLGYIVCNPATKHWATVAVCASCPPSKAILTTHTYLAFDPAVSSHFHLIQFWKGAWREEGSWINEEIMMFPWSVLTYSSETGVWSHNQTHWNEQGQLEGWRRQGILKYNQRTFVNGILHLIVSDEGRRQIIAVDVQGKTKRTITTPDAAEKGRWCDIPCIGQSQGLLHYINQAHSLRQVQSYEISIWALDYDTQEWVLKDTVSSRRLFGRMPGSWYSVVIHPDRNVVFFHQRSKLIRLIAYDMDSKKVSVVCTGNLPGQIVPYIPCFSESLTVTNKN